MDLIAGAMGNLAPKLLQLIQDEYKLHDEVKAQVKSLAKELESIHIALCKVGEVPYDQLDSQVKHWASEAREASYDMEDILDNFFVRVTGHHQTTDANNGKFRRRIKKMLEKFSLSRIKTDHDIAGAIEDIKKQVDEMTKRRDRYKVGEIGTSSAKIIDPRIMMTQTTLSDLVGIDEPKDALLNILTRSDDDKETKVVSIVGSGGLGKTTLAKAVYDQLTMDMDINFKAFVSVGRNPDLKKVFRDILRDLDKSRYMNNISYFLTLEEKQLIEEIEAFVKEKRYFIVIDDVWEVKSWNNIRTALRDNYLGSKIMVTTRINAVAELVHCTYKMQPLPLESSKKLFCGRIFGSPDMCPEILSEVSDKILKKCDGVPLAIITIASLLANKSDDVTEWQEICNSIGSGLSQSNDMYHDMIKILSLSYYDLPSQMKACFLYLSMYPEDYEITRDRLIWSWISEGFIQPRRQGEDVFELGISYFNDLINRSLVQPLVNKFDEIISCRVHDMILDLICSFSKDGNFITTSDHIQQVISSESMNIRRLSLKNTACPKKCVSQVRSVAIFGSSIDSMPSFPSFHMLRVLDLEGYSLNGSEISNNKLSVGNLIHLRYLGLRGTGLRVFPGGIEKLQFLQVLRTDFSFELPQSVFSLKRLLCLQGVYCCPRSGNLLRNLASLQVLDYLYLDMDPAGIVEALGHLTQLTKLVIYTNSEVLDQSICDALVDSLGNLVRLQHLRLDDKFDNVIRWKRWAPPPHLRVVPKIFAQTLPRWVSPTTLSNLTDLSMVVYSVGPDDLQILGSLPNLVKLVLRADRQNYFEQPLPQFMIGNDGFPRLRLCRFLNIVTAPSTFNRGRNPVPRVANLWFSIRAKDFFSNPGKGLDFNDLAMDHFPSLRYVTCIFDGETDVTEQEAKKLKMAVVHAAKVHPNRPYLSFW